MKLEDIKAELKELNGYERYLRYRKHSKHVKRTAFWHTNFEHWSDEMFLEFYNFTELDILPQKKARGMQKGFKKEKGLITYKVNGVLMDIKQIKKQYPSLLRSNIDGQIKRKGFYENKNKTIHITREK